MSDLFRTQAVEWQINRLHGEVLILPYLPYTLILSFLIIFVSVAIWWLTSSTYARKETISGWLEPPNGVTRVYAEDTGIIKQVLIKDGDMVTDDQPLIIVNGDRYLVTGDQLESRLLFEYETQQTLLNEQLGRTASIYQRRRIDLMQQISTIKQDLILLDEQLNTLDERYELVKQQVQRQQMLKTRGFVSEIDIDNSIANELALRNEKQALKREYISRQNAIEQMRTELDLLPDQNANDVVQLRTRMSDVAQKIASLYGQRSYVIKATRRGIVNNLQAQIGQKVYAGKDIPLLTVIPSELGLSAHLLVPVRSAGFIESGQKLDIRYDAFPYQKFGLYKGEIIGISDSVLMPNELLNTPLRIQEPVFRITAKLQQLHVNAYDKEFPLKPGMTLSADVRLGERTLLQWLLEPVYSIKGRL